MSDRVGQMLRCFCYSKPILGIVKLDGQNKPFVHIKIYKGHRIYGEILLKRGDMRVRCRDCFRWHTIRILPENAVMESAPEHGDITELVENPH